MVNHDARHSLLPVDLASMAHAHHLHEEPVVVHVIDDPVVAGTDAISMFFTGELATAGWPRVVTEQHDHRSDALLVLARQRAQRLERTAIDLNAIAHTSPRSALTSSHGT